MKIHLAILSLLGLSTLQAQDMAVCTMEYAPVCATYDSGIRCIKAPCPSARHQTFPNACAAKNALKNQSYSLKSGVCREQSASSPTPRPQPTQEQRGTRPQNEPLSGACPKIYAPVCGYKKSGFWIFGQAYIQEFANSCLMKNAGFTLKNQGSCLY